ncbi:EF-hand domain-containing protein [Ostreiculturibacter nitratireducens]|uniref:EF-hand domain-containing protein n=1 Tax=Ostreiculturibacter nitratireducens TaxID=3075226 RepID=UPI0031B647B7
MTRKKLGIGLAAVLGAAVVALPIVAGAQGMGKGPMRGEGQGQGMPEWAGEMRGEGMMGYGFEGRGEGSFGGMSGWGGGAIDFAALDADGDGKVTEEEIKAYRQSRIEGLDADGNGLISAEEMTAHMMAGVQERIEAAAQRRIEAQDLDGDGALSAAELVVPPQPMAIFDRLDTDNDGAVSQEEFDAARTQFRDRMQGGMMDRRGGGHHRGEGYRFGGDDDGRGGFWRRGN